MSMKGVSSGLTSNGKYSEVFYKVFLCPIKSFKCAMQMNSCIEDVSSSVSDLMNLYADLGSPSCKEEAEAVFLSQVRYLYPKPKLLVGHEEC